MATPKRLLDTAIYLIDLLNLIPAHPRSVTTTELHRTLQNMGRSRSLRSIQRQMDVLCQHFPELEQQSRGRPYRYCWRTGTRGLDLRDREEALALVLGHALLGPQLPPAIHDWLRPLQEAAHRVLHGDNGADRAASQWTTKVAFLPALLPLTGPAPAPDVLTTVVSALYHNHRVTLDHRADTDVVKHPRFRPLGLCVQEGLYYLVGQDDNDTPIDALALHRIVAAQDTGEAFDYPPTFSLAAWCAGGRMNSRPGNLVRLHFLLRHDAACLLQDAQLSLDQRLKPSHAHPGYDEISATVQDGAQLERWLNSWGDRILRVHKMNAPAA